MYKIVLWYIDPSTTLLGSILPLTSSSKYCLFCYYILCVYEYVCYVFIACGVCVNLDSTWEKYMLFGISFLTAFSCSPATLSILFLTLYSLRSIFVSHTYTYIHSLKHLKFDFLYKRKHSIYASWPFCLL